MARAPQIPKPTPAELDLLRVIWQLGPATVKQVHQHAHKERPEITYATVLRLMQVMHGKGLLARDESERSHVYSSAVAQGSLQSTLLRDLIDKAFSGSGKAMVMAALRGHVTKKEREDIQAFLRGDES